MPNNSKHSLFQQPHLENLSWKDVKDITRLKGIIRYTILSILSLVILISNLFSFIHFPILKLGIIIGIALIYQTIFYFVVKMQKDVTKEKVLLFYRINYFLIFCDIILTAYASYITNGIFSPFLVIMMFDLISTTILFPTALSIWVFIISIAVIGFETLIFFWSGYKISQMLKMNIIYSFLENHDLIFVISIFYITFFSLSYFSINLLVRSPVQNLFISRKLQELEAVIDELHQTHSELEATYELSEVISSTLKLDQMLTLIAEGIKKSLGFNIVLLSLLNSSKKFLIREAKAGISDEDFEILKKQEIDFKYVTKLFQEKYKVGNCYYISHNAKLDINITDYTWISPFLKDSEEDSANKWHPEDMLLIPLKIKRTGDIIGMISVDDPIDGKVPSLRKFRMLELFSNSACTAIENMRLFSDKIKQIRQLKSLHDISSTLTLELDKQELIKKVVGIIKNTYKFLNTAILLIDPEKNILKVVAKEGYANQKIEDIEIKIGDGITGWVADSGLPLVVNDVTADPRYIEGFSGAKSELAVPLKYKTEVIGVLDVEAEHFNAFDKTDLDTLKTLANYIAAYIKNAELHQETENLAKTDSLTGLFNRRVFKDMLLKELQRAKRYNHPFSLIMIDIDNFKKYNDTFGHPEGDSVIKSLAQVFRASTRDVDTIARYGGEEFIIILPETAKQDAANIAERIRRNFKRINFYPRTASKPLNMTISLGVATFPKDGTIAELLVNNVDNALYQSKRTGKDKISVL